MQQCIDQFACFDVPNANRRIGRASHDDLLVVLETENASVVASENLDALARLPVPDLDGVVA